MKKSILNIKGLRYFLKKVKNKLREQLQAAEAQTNAVAIVPEMLRDLGIVK